MKVSKAEVEKGLSKKGFRKEKSSHHIYFHHEYEGVETGVNTYISHSSKQKDIAGDLLSSMKKQLKLDSTKDAVDLIKCPMDKEQYEKILIDKGIFDPQQM